MYVDVDISAPLGRRLVIPSSGVLQAGNRQIAFIDHGQGSLEPREIETGPRLDDSIVVLKGLKAGDRIVTSANFLIDSEAQLQGSMGGFAQLPTSAGAEQKSSDQFHIELATQPSPPRKGENTLRVNLTGADGKVVAGAAVSVTFFMPAMPAMGMSAMHVVSTLADKGQGMYEGSVQLGAGGTWDVTVTATRNGQAVANKKLSLNATGGM
jgi:YtkA-like